MTTSIIHSNKAARSSALGPNKSASDKTVLAESAAAKSKPLSEIRAQSPLQGDYAVKIKGGDKGVEIQGSKHSDRIEVERQNGRIDISVENQAGKQTARFKDTGQPVKISPNAGADHVVVKGDNFSVADNDNSKDYARAIGNRNTVDSELASVVGNNNTLKGDMIGIEGDNNTGTANFIGAATGDNNTVKIPTSLVGSVGYACFKGDNNNLVTDNPLTAINNAGTNTKRNGEPIDSLMQRWYSSMRSQFNGMEQ